MSATNTNAPLAVTTPEGLGATDVNDPSQADGDQIDESEVEAEVVAAIPTSFEINDEASANWLVRRIAEARAHSERVSAFAAREIRRAEQTERWLFLRYGRQLQEWVTKELARRRGRSRSLDLPDGRVGYRAEPERLVVNDEQSVLDWARASCPTAIITSYRISRTALRQHLVETAELPDGVTVEPARDRFYLK